MAYLGRFRLPGKASALPLYALLDGIPEEFVGKKQFFEELGMAISQLELGNLTEARDKLSVIKRHFPENKILNILWQSISDPERNASVTEEGVYLG